MAQRKNGNKNNHTEPQQAVAVPQQAGMPTLPDESTLPTEYGEGISYDPADQLTTLVSVLQTGSPQVNRTNAAYIPGANAGDIWLKNAIPPTVAGATGIFFQPCYFNKVWLEWRPRAVGGGGGQGFAGRHGARDLPDGSTCPDVDDARRAPDPQDPKKTIWTRANGNILQETRQHFGLVHVRGEFVTAPDGQNIHIASGFSPYCIPFTSTGHTVSKNWNGRLKGLRTPSGRVLNAYDTIWHMTLRQTSNAKGTWYLWHVNYAGRANTEEAMEGKSVFDDCKRGDRIAEQPMDDDTNGNVTIESHAEAAL